MSCSTNSEWFTSTAGAAKGRTGTVIGCWLIQNHQSTPDRVLRHLMELTAAQRDFFWHTPNTPEQEEYVKAWEPYL